MYLSHLGRRFPAEPKEISIRIAFVSTSICGFLLITLYRSMISASLAVKIFHHPVSDLDGIVESPYQLMLSKGSSIHNMFLEAKENTPYRRVLDSGKLLTVSSFPEGSKMLLKGTDSTKINRPGHNIRMY